MTEPMKLGDFIDNYRDAIANKVVETYPPLYRPNGVELPYLLRQPMGAQRSAIEGAAQSLESNQGTIVVGEMGTGKTFIAAAAAHLADFRRNLVLCPPHLTRKWKREVEQTVPSAHVAIVKSITDLKRLNYVLPNKPLYVIMSRERAKLTYRWRPAIFWKWQTEDGRLVHDKEDDQPFQVPCCPVCAALVSDKEGVPLDEATLQRRKHFCKKCGSALWQADKKGPRRYALSDYIKKHMRGYFDLLISDEVHEYKGRGSAQGIAAGVLADACGKTLSLSGTLMGGYSSTLFHLLYRFSPLIRDHYEHNHESRWIKDYGFIERTEPVKKEELDEDGRYSKLKKYARATVKEKPGLAPGALFHIIGNTIFLKLSDVASALPPYQEEVSVSHMSNEPDPVHGHSQAQTYAAIQKELYKHLLEALKRGSKKLLSTYLQTLLSYPDAVTKGETVFNPEDGDIIIQAPPLAESEIYPKERALINLVRTEREAGRRVLVYVTHTNTRDITPRMERMLKREGFKVAVLKANSVNPDRREKWVQDQVRKGIDVLICHPKLVQTGLDLIDFPTICWYEIDYSVYVMRQASRRSWRIGQHRPVKVVYMAYANTLQADALALVAKKMQASLAVEGELPDEGLAVYGDSGDDLIMTLARKIVTGEEPENVQEVFMQSQAQAEENEQLLVTEDWDAPPVHPEPVEVLTDVQEDVQEEVEEQPAVTIDWESFNSMFAPARKVGQLALF